MSKIKNINNKLCFLDMDGVLCDFVGGMCRAYFPDKLLNINPFEVYKLFSSLKETEDNFLEPTEKAGFWFNLPILPAAKELVELLKIYFEVQNMCILTAPLYSSHNCVSEKIEWIKKYFPELSENIIFTEKKRFLSRKNCFLIDDMEKNIEEFNSCGGNGILYPQPWNKLYENHFNKQNARVEYKLYLKFWLDKQEG